MRCVDVNVLVYAHRPDAPDHGRWLAWLDGARAEREPLGLMTAVVTGFVRIVTHPKVFDDPTPITAALDFVTAIRASPAARRVEPGDRHGEIFDELCRQTSARGNRVPDASIAAVAIEHNAALVTADLGFRRFDGLRVEHPLV